MNTCPRGIQQSVLNLLSSISLQPHRAPVLKLPLLHAAMPWRERFICTAWELLPTPALKSVTLCTATEAAPMTSIPASRGSSGHLEIIFPAQTPSRLPEEFANMIYLILPAHFHFRGTRGHQKKSLSKLFSFLMWLLISEGWTR